METSSNIKSIPIVPFLVKFQLLLYEKKRKTTVVGFG